MENTNIIELKNLIKRYGDFYAVDDLSLYIRKGEFVTLLGPSGCGKTTTLQMIAGFVVPDEGKVYFNGVDITELPPHKRNINTVFQRYALFPHLNVFNNIAFGLKLKTLDKAVVDKKGNVKIKKVHLSKAEITKKVKNALKIVGLSNYEERDVTSLSGGQQQRVAIARAIVNEPQVLLLDEPLGALDLKMRKDMQLELKEMHKKLGITFIYVTHDQEEALGISDRIAVMNKGKIEQYGTSDGIYEYPKSRFVASFVGRMNFFEAEIREIRDENVLVQITETGANSEAFFMVSKPSEKMLPAFGGQLAVGQTVLFCVRPEKFLIRAASSKDFAPGYSTEVFQNIMQGVLEREIYYGSESRFFVDVGEYSVMATRLIHSRGLSRNDEPIEQDLVLGQPVQLSWHVRD